MNLFAISRVYNLIATSEKFRKIKFRLNLMPNIIVTHDIIFLIKYMFKGDVASRGNASYFVEDVCIQVNSNLKDVLNNIAFA